MESFKTSDGFNTQIGTLSLFLPYNNNNDIIHVIMLKNNLTFKFIYITPTPTQKHPVKIF